MIDPTQASKFLEEGRVAVIGASDERSNFGRTVCEALLAHGTEVVAVHPSATSSAGAPCYPTISAAPQPVDTAIVMVPASASAGVVEECIASGIKRIWLFKGFGAGAVSAEAVEACRSSGVEVIEGACPLMFLEPVRGIHSFHRTLRRMNRSVARGHAAA